MTLRLGSTTYLTLVAIALTGAIVGLAKSQPADLSKPDYRSPLAAVEDVCVTSANPGEMVRKVRATGWRALEGDAIPALVRGNSMVSYREVREGRIGGQPLLLAVGELGGTSFCRVYFPAGDVAATQRRLESLSVLDAPLGTPDFTGPLNDPQGWSAIGWHRSAGQQWRAVHYAFDPAGKGLDAAWQSIEVTREG